MKKPSLSTLCVALAASLTVSAFQQAPQQPPQQTVFKAGTRTVPVYATVTDANRRLVPDLTQEDFEIYDNGKKVDILLFDNRVVPFSAVLALDSSASMTLNIEFVQDAAVQFLIRMLPEDRATVGFFNATIRYRDGMTSDRDALVRYVREERRIGNETKLWDAFDTALDHLRDETSRKVVVALTDGDDYGSAKSDDDVRLRAQAEDVMVYAIGIESRYFNGLQRVISRPGGAFRKLAIETGGGFFELRKTDELNSTFSRVIQELHSQYLLGFAPAVLDGKEHELEVKLKKSGLTARARRSYVAQ